MDLSMIPYIAATHERLGWLEQRQEVLAENVANADTPDYRPRDLKALDFDKLLRDADTRLGLAATDESHLGGTGPSGLAYAEQVERKPYETSPDGNAVVLEQQLAKVDETRLVHRLANELYRKHLGFFRIAIGSR